MICRRAATRLVRQPIAVIASLRGRPHWLFPAASSAAYRAPLRLIGICAVTALVAGPDARLSRSLPRQGARHQVLRSGDRRLPNGGLSQPPQASSREVPDLSGSGPSPWPASFAAQALILLRLSPVTRLGEVMWRPSTRLRALEEIRHHLVVNLCRVLYEVVGNIFSLISTVLPFTGRDRREISHKLQVLYFFH